MTSPLQAFTRNTGWSIALIPGELPVSLVSIPGEFYLANRTNMNTQIPVPVLV